MTTFFEFSLPLPPCLSHPEVAWLWGNLTSSHIPFGWSAWSTSFIPQEQIITLPYFQGLHDVVMPFRISEYKYNFIFITLGSLANEGCSVVASAAAILRNNREPGSGIWRCYRFLGFAVLLLVLLLLFYVFFFSGGRLGASMLWICLLCTLSVCLCVVRFCRRYFHCAGRSIQLPL